VGFREHLREEVADEVVVVAVEPVVLVVLRPPLGRVDRLVPREPLAVGVRDVEGARRTEREDAADPFGMLGGEVHGPRGARRESDHNRTVRPGGVEDGYGVRRILSVGVCGGAGRTARVATAATVERDDPVVAGEVRDLGLPELRRDDRPRG
jgi:hypothetical protein